MIHINKVQELTGVTVRTLRYYDTIHLLKPAAKSDGGHRLYTNEEIKKLQQIQFLKGIGFKLQEIKTMLDSDHWDWSESLDKQLTYIIEKQHNLKKMEHSLRELINGIEVEGEDEWTAIQKFMQLSHADQDMQTYYRESIFNNEEIDLWKKVPTMSSDEPDSLEWMALLGQLKRYAKDGPHSPSVQAIIQRMDEKRLEDFEEENEFIDKLWKIRMSAAQSEKLGLYPIDQDVLKLMEDAYAIYAAGKESQNE
ncbi:MerR family transcriptional regulator [Sporosarcina obsidiansis]|uniref:MerR family transcriptional regulator n=1 Tax=Sporosarcina obsidiansis TaxID=2660748 RepID=UPI00129BEFBA|nr:MerR family transcriptional regulator [Sporosarcina obsidiansis]